MTKKKSSKTLVELPEHIQNQSVKVREKYVQWLEVSDKIHNHRDRFYVITDISDPEETVQLDLLQGWYGIKKKTAHLNEEDLKPIKKAWSKLQKLKAEKGHLKRNWQSAGINIEQKSVLFSRKMDVIELFGQWRNVKEVEGIIKNDWGMFVTKGRLKEFSLANKEKIGHLRDNWEATYSDFSIAKKRGRLERYSFLLETQMSKYKENELYSVTRAREIRSILEQARKEIEGDNININIKGGIDVNLTIQANKTLGQITRQISVTSLIIALVAAKANIDPTVIMAQLQRSYYSNYSGIKGIGGKEEGEEIEYPSTGVYDWISIEKKHAEEVEFEEIKLDVKEEEKKTIDTARNKLLQILESTKKDHTRKVIKSKQ